MRDQSNHVSIEGSTISGRDIVIGSNNSIVASTDAPSVSETPAPGSHVFMSYSRADRGTAIEFCAALEFSGVAMWRDEADLVGGELWRDAIRSAIDDSVAMVVLITPGSVTRNWSGQHDEILFARDRRREFHYPILPAIVGSVNVPSIPVGPETTTLADLQWLELDVSQPEICAARIVAALRAL